MDKHVLSLNENWKFHHGELPDAWKKDFDDSSWEEVTLPHFSFLLQRNRICCRRNRLVPGYLLPSGGLSTQTDLFAF